ncbi:hypothetical protein FQZ97_1021570 [compost metagenome]
MLDQHAEACADQRAGNLEGARELLFRQGVTDPHGVFLGEFDDPPGQLQVIGAGLLLSGLAQGGLLVSVRAALMPQRRTTNNNRKLLTQLDCWYFIAKKDTQPRLGLLQPSKQKQAIERCAPP